jgi:IclR family pca regulon transcriptional regulator
MEVALVTRDRLQAIYVDRAAPASARVTLGLSLGSTLPLLHTAMGRMLLARSGAEVLDQTLRETGRSRHTEASLTDPAGLRREIATAREQGYCITRNEFEPGAAGVAVPVGALGDVPFVLGTTGSINRFYDPATLDRVLDVLRHAALSIGRIAA